LSLNGTRDFVVPGEAFTWKNARLRAKKLSRRPKPAFIVDGRSAPRTGRRYEQPEKPRA
jgi:hypothetical protein